MPITAADSITLALEHTKQQLFRPFRIAQAHRVVAVHAAFELQRENPFQITTPAGHKSIAPLPGRDLKTAIELGDVLFPQKPVRRLQRP